MKKNYGMTSKNKTEDKNVNNAPELVIGLSGALGTDLKKVISKIDQSLHNRHYKSHHVKLSKLMASLEIEPGLEAVDDLQTDERIEKLMEAGNKFRENWPDSNGDGIANLAISEFARIREEYWKNDPLIDDDSKLYKPIPNTAYIVDSLKHPDEVKFFRKIYGDAFILISVYEPKEIRHNQLVKRIEKSKHGLSTVLDKNQQDWLQDRAFNLIEKDEKENKSYGQSVRDVFHLADLFVSSIHEKETGLSISEQIDRFIDLLFGAPFVTPTIDEHGIFMAHSVALKSADLSRQVGAVILTENGEMVSSGCNEVPSIGGPPYWEAENSSRPDSRDYAEGEDASVKMKHHMVKEVMQCLKDGGWLNKSYNRETPEKLCEDALYGEDKSKNILNQKGILKNTRVANIIEFGRMVHAEMSAITDAVRRGISTKDKTLYCTTFPCHMCARHILASGIKKVVFVEPYAKSMAAELYKGLMKVDGDKDALDGALVFEPFIGISPKRFSYLFSMENKNIKRKDKKTGLADTENTLKNGPFLDNSNPYAYFSEKVSLENLKKQLDQ